ncbi:MAG: hypothetical protein HUJ13_11160 [Hydrogenovibrio crunogenus]|nr:hypothetical protein [Hydrogenovibrio crunogenus]
MPSNLTSILEKHQAFFAFGQHQFDEKKQEGIEYVSMGAGLICPKDNAKQLYQDMKADNQRVIEEDLAKNSRKDIIWRELANHEAQITNSIDDTVDALDGYGISEAEIAEEYKVYFAHCVEHDLF